VARTPRLAETAADETSKTTSAREGAASSQRPQRQSRQHGGGALQRTSWWGRAMSNLITNGGGKPPTVWKPVKLRHFNEFTDDIDYVAEYYNSLCVLMRDIWTGTIPEGRAGRTRTPSGANRALPRIDAPLRLRRR
jgi:hypothetical protein